MNESTVRDQLRVLLDWTDAHVSLDQAIEGVPAEARGGRVDAFPHTLWQLLEHIRIAQADILDFCRNPAYEHREWPAAYWPPNDAPPTTEWWTDSVQQIQRDRAALQALATSSDLDLTATIPHGDGQTYVREILLVADHTAYHVGQIVALRRMLGNWHSG